MRSDRRIDHLVIAVHDLDAAADHYGRLGFLVGARNRHPWGTHNRIVQFRTSFLELITVGEPALIPPHGSGRFSFGAFVRDFLARREGLAMFVADSGDAVSDAAHFARAGIGAYEPFHFERTGRRPDGSETRVAFSLAFAVDPALPDAAFFTCQQHVPENFWNPAFQHHPNGAADVADVTLTAPDPSAHEAFLARFLGVPPVGHSFGLLGGGALRLERAADGGFAQFAVVVRDLGKQAERLGREGIAFAATGDRLTVDAGENAGVAVAFVEARERDGTP